MPTNPDADGLKIEQVHLIDAPAARVFASWLDAKTISQWLGPRSIVECAEPLIFEPKVGGRFRIPMRMRQPQPNEMIIVSGVFREIRPSSLLVLTWKWEHETTQTLVTVRFRPVGDRTEVKLLHENFGISGSRDSHDWGWVESFQQLARTLKTRCQSNDFQLSKYISNS